MSFSSFAALQRLPIIFLSVFFYFELPQLKHFLAIKVSFCRFLPPFYESHANKLTVSIRLNTLSKWLHPGNLCWTQTSESFISCCLNDCQTEFTLHLTLECPFFSQQTFGYWVKASHVKVHLVHLDTADGP